MTYCSNITKEQKDIVDKIELQDCNHREKYGDNPSDDITLSSYYMSKLIRAIAKNEREKSKR